MKLTSVFGLNRKQEAELKEQLYAATAEIVNKHINEEPALETKTTSELVKEIHETFFSAPERLLREAKEIIANISIDESAARLSELGFTGVAKARQAHAMKIEQSISKELAEIITYYSMALPAYKFITISEVNRICKKYSLVFGDAERYIGDIPEKNVKEIISFDSGLVKEEDRLFKVTSWDMGRSTMYVEQKDLMYYDGSDSSFSRHYEISKNIGFMICAPQSDMRIERHERVEKNRIVSEIPDPVVLYPVRGGYLVISAWGDEAADVVNEKMN